jgi:hypothetical protein
MKHGIYWSACQITYNIKNQYLTYHSAIQDHCTDQHTAANDQRGSSTWKASDDTGIFGLAFCHDQLLRLINIVQSGERYNLNINKCLGFKLNLLLDFCRAYFPMTMIDFLLKATQSNKDNPKKCGFLYDIGCNMEKGIIRVRKKHISLISFNILDL